MGRRKGLVKVELREMSHNASLYEREKAFRTMMAIFKRQVNEAGILSEYKERQYYESPGEKRKRKREVAARERRKEESRVSKGF